MGDWLAAQEWDIFATMTYPVAYSARSARRAQEHFWKRYPGSVVWVTETGSHGEQRIHNHALIRTNTDDLDHLGKDCAYLFRKWRNLYQGRCSFDPYISEAGARYCAKYITKKPDDWDIK